MKKIYLLLVLAFSFPVIAQMDTHLINECSLFQDSLLKQLTTNLKGNKYLAIKNDWRKRKQLLNTLLCQLYL